MTTLQHIQATLSAHRPQVLPLGGKRRAAVALVVCEPPRPATGAPAPRVLFIERTQQDGDPWSGHLAFPGGGVEEQDRSVRDTAERETLEEIGLDLCSSLYFGRLDDLTGTTVPVVVSGFVYGATHVPSFKLNHEVRKAFWFSLEELIDAKRHSHYRIHYDGVKRTVPAIDLLGPGRPVLWGLTYRFVMQFLKLLGYEMPAMPLQQRC